jgi:uncharacterized protein YndB with AHSA1/START domain
MNLYQMKKQLIAKKSIDINAPVSKIWNVITTEESVSVFMLGMKPQTDWKEGSPINWAGRHEGEEHNMAKGLIQELSLNKKLQYSFFYGGYGHTDVPEHYQTVVLELEPLNDKQTRLKAQQGDYSIFEDGETYVKHADHFWSQAVLKIKELSEAQ